MFNSAVAAILLALTFTFSPNTQAARPGRPEVKIGDIIKNTKEGKSRYFNWIGRWHLKRLKKENPTTIQLQLQNFFSSVSTSCQYQFLDQMDQKLKDVKWKRNYKRNRKPLLYKARQLNLIDDVVLGLLLKSIKDQRHFKLRKRPQLYRLNYKGEFEPQYLETFKQTETALERGACLSQAWSGAIGRLRQLEADPTRKNVRRALAKFLRKKQLSQKGHAFLEMARRAKLEERPLSLSSYVGRLSQMRGRFGYGDGTSDVVTDKVEGDKQGRRERLYSRYDNIQIQLLSNLVDKMRVRLDAFEVAIEVRNDEGNVLEEIILEPLEQYRFAAKMVRKEMELLKTSTIMKGKSVNYMDLVTAAFETGLVKSVELEELAKIEEIWNPRVPFKTKVVNFIKTYGGLTSVFLPPGYNLIPVVGILILEAFTRDNTQNQERNHALF